MKFIFVFLIATIVAISSCSTSNIDASGSEQKFNVNEALIARGVLQITLPNERPSSLAIQTPSGEWFVLQDSSESIQIMPQNRFNTIEIMQFELNKLMGTVWREGISYKELIFKNNGSYLIYFANNLETETENTFSFQESISYRIGY